MSSKAKLEEELAIDLELHQHIILISCLLKQLLKTDGDQKQDIPCDSIFNSNTVPQIKIDDYLRRIHKFTNYSSECLIISMIYMDRYNLANQNFTLNWQNVHRLLLGCLLLAVKYQDDFYYDNKAFETAGGVNVVQLQNYQFQIFQKCNFNLWVDEEVYEQFLMSLYEAYGNNDDTDQQTD